ncbi:MAG: ROK family protein [Chloroflexi bacterium]|nr:MAG: ROK family protein [Chloroflexota bacterium]
MNRMHKHAPVSRSALAEMTGLNKTTVSSLVQELIDHQFVREIGFDTAGTGRPARLLEFNPEAGCIISAEIIDTGFISVICANFTNNIIWRTKETFDHKSNPQTAIRRLFTLLHQAVDATRTVYGPVLGLAVGVPGLVDHKSDTLLFAPNLNWENVPLGVLLREEFGRLVFVDNEANLAALGEYYFGAAKECNNALYISGSVGIGGGIIHGGQLVTGATGFAGELGHMTIDPHGELCSCGSRGCWETLVSQSAIFNRIQQAIDRQQPTILSKKGNGNSDQLTVSALSKAARAGDKLVLTVLEETACYLGIGIASLVNVLNPELVVLGGIHCSLGEFMLPTIKQELKHRALRWSAKATRVVLAQQGSDACVMGGLARVYQAILAQPGAVTN